MSKKIKGTDEAWENGSLGEDLEFAKAADSEHQEYAEKVLGMQMISIRLPAELIDDLKGIANYRGIGYQPLIRDVLKRFARSEVSTIMHELMKGREENLKAKSTSENKPPRKEAKPKKAA